MDAENISSHATYVNAVTLESPLYKSRDTKVAENSYAQTSWNKRINDVPKQSGMERVVLNPRFVTPHTITNMGVDTMISSAAVIHELAYGRMDNTTPSTKTPSYATISPSLPARLDLIV